MAGLTEARVFLERVHVATGERTGRVEVTGRTERHIDKLWSGMIRNLADGWVVDLVEEPAIRAALSPKQED